MIDELNILGTKNNRIEQRIRLYFEEMPEISEEQVQERTTFAKNMYGLMLLFLSMVGAAETTGMVQDIDYYISMITRRYTDIIENQFGERLALGQYVEEIARSIVNTTFDRIDSAYILSEERAFDISVNEANTVVGDDEYMSAIEEGKTQKRWLTEKDNKVRPTHSEVDETIVGINDYFHVGSCDMLYPHDSVNGDAEEVCGCRCHVEYL